jgi:hypothetical protein
MGLFLMNHPVSKIMDMIQNNSFFDAADSRRAESSDRRTRTKAGTLLANGSRKAPNRMHLHH